ncbi:MAG: DUF4397 domain-containing protein [Rhodothermales bacterium]
MRFFLSFLCTFVFFLPDAIPATASSSGFATHPPDAAGSNSTQAQVQFIHNIVDAGPVDIYLDDILWLNDRPYQSATAFQSVLHGTHKIDIVEGNAPDNTHPLWTGNETFSSDVNYVVAVQGRSFDTQLVVRDNVRMKSFDDNMQLFFIQGSPDTGPIDVRVLDPHNANKVILLLHNNFLFGNKGAYWPLAAGEYNFEIMNAGNTEQFGTFWFNLQGFARRSLVFLSSGPGKSPGSGFTLLAFDVDGNTIFPSVTTATSEAAEVPTAFALHANYPNPFNPRTQIRYALPEHAAVRLDIFDALGRRVRTLVDVNQAAGIYTVAWDGRNDAGTPVVSSVYFYRIVAGDFVETRKMLLLK